MAINIKNPATDKLARELASCRRVGVTEAVHMALERALAEAQADRAAEIARRRKENDRILAEVAKLPILDDRPTKVIRDELWDDVLDSHR
jgi:antitoxin VapB